MFLPQMAIDRPNWHKEGFFPVYVLLGSSLPWNQTNGLAINTTALSGTGKLQNKFPCNKHKFLKASYEYSFLFCI